jgi:hypothetical protein
MTIPEIIQLVERYLQNKRVGGIALHASQEGARQEGKWWYVSVRPEQEPAKRYEYYEVLADVETEIEDKENITVLLVPVAAQTISVAA